MNINQSLEMPQEISRSRFVKVAVPCPLYKTFDYRLASSHGQNIQPGVRVRVPFGRQKLRLSLY